MDDNVSFTSKALGVAYYYYHPHHATKKVWHFLHHIVMRLTKKTLSNTLVRNRSD